MPKLAVSRSQIMGAPIEKVFAKVRDFQSWPEWSPWLMADPECQLDFSKDEYGWEGEIAGIGEMKIVEEQSNRSISYALSFQKPYRSEAAVQMLFAEEGQKTRVTWKMDSSLPFFLFWMHKSLQGFIEMDYERGLLMLKDLMEQDSVPSKLSFHGREQFQGFVGVGKKSESCFKEIESQMAVDLEKVREYYPKGEAFAVYYKWDVVKRRVAYLIGVKVPELPQRIPTDLEGVTVPDLTVYSLTHSGAYRHLGNAWAAGMAHGQAKRWKADKKFPPFELYQNEKEDDGRVRICLPMK